MKRQLISLVLMLLPMVASAAVEIDSIYYKLNSQSKVAEVTNKPGWFGCYTGSIIIPEFVMYEGMTYSVKAIGDNAFYLCGKLTDIIIPNNVTSIGAFAFYGCRHLKE